MNKKWLKSCSTILLILLAATIMTSCVEDNMSFSSRFSDMIEYELDDISLTIYYMGFSFRTRIPITLDRLKGGATYKVVVTGQELAEHRDLLNQLANVELIPSRDRSFACARMYYVFEHSEHGEIFSFLTYAMSYNMSDFDGVGAFDTVFINGQEVRGNRIFFEAVLPFLPEHVVREIQTNIDTWLPASE